MKKIIVLLIIASSFWACSKESSTPTNTNTTNTTDSIRYVVNTTNAQNWIGYYYDENNQKVTITNQSTGGWQVSFLNKAAKPRGLEISATAIGINPSDSFTIETKIFSNGGFVGFYFIKGTGNKAEVCTSKATLN